MMAINAAIAARGEGDAPQRGAGARHRPTAPTRRPPRWSAIRCARCPAGADGDRHRRRVEAALGPDVAAIMVTNPNTCGLFEREIVEIAAAVHAAGAYFYCDGANFNAIVGQGAARRSRRRRHAHQPAQDLLDAARRRRAGRGAGGVFASASRPSRRCPGSSRRTTACAWSSTREGAQALRPDDAPSTARWACSCARSPIMLSHGADGLRQVAEDAVLNANYVRALPQRADVAAVRRAPVHARGPVRRPLARRTPASRRSISPRR